MVSDLVIKHKFYTDLYEIGGLLYCTNRQLKEACDLLRSVGCVIFIDSDGNICCFTDDIELGSDIIKRTKDSFLRLNSNTLIAKS